MFSFYIIDSSGCEVYLFVILIIISIITFDYHFHSGCIQDLNQNHELDLTDLFFPPVWTWSTCKPILGEQTMSGLVALSLFLYPAFFLLFVRRLLLYRWCLEFLLSLQALTSSLRQGFSALLGSPTKQDPRHIQLCFLNLVHDKHLCFLALSISFAELCSCSCCLIVLLLKLMVPQALPLVILGRRL